MTRLRTTLAPSHITRLQTSGKQCHTRATRAARECHRRTTTATRRADMGLHYLEKGREGRFGWRNQTWRWREWNNIRGIVSRRPDSRVQRKKKKLLTTINLVSVKVMWQATQSGRTTRSNSEVTKLKPLKRNEPGKWIYEFIYIN